MTKFCVEGVNLGRIVERARARGVPLFSVELHEKVLTFCTKRAYAPTMIAILNNMCYHCKNKKAGAEQTNCYAVRGYWTGKTLLSRALLGAFALVFACSCFWVNGRVLDIEIHSDNDALVLSMLDEYGIKQGARVQDIKDVEHYLNRRLDARYVFVRQEGVKLSVEVWAKNDQPLEEAGQSVTAPCDGVVQSVILLSGTAKVKAGDEVRAGDVLIEGKITSEQGGEITCRAVGEIFLECDVTRTFEYETVRKSAYRTGRSESYTELDLLFGSYGKKYNPFENFETSVSESVINSLFPVRVRRVSFFELAYVTETVDFEKVKDFVLAEKTKEAVAASENQVLSTRTEVSGEETKTISVIMRTLVKVGG